MLKESIETRKKWEEENFKFIYDKIHGLETEVAFRYLKKTGQFLKESGRQVYDGTFTGDIDLLINYTNAILILNKMKHYVLRLQHTSTNIDEHL